MNKLDKYTGNLIVSINKDNISYVFSEVYEIIIPHKNLIYRDTTSPEEFFKKDRRVDYNNSSTVIVSYLEKEKQFNIIQDLCFYYILHNIEKQFFLHAKSYLKLFKEGCCS